jgi:hypothetical protein
MCVLQPILAAGGLQAAVFDTRRIFPASALPLGIDESRRKSG